MPIYVYRCDCGHRFERLVPTDAEPPGCPQCGSDTHKIPAGPQLGGRARAHRQAGRISPAWHGLEQGGPEKVQREVEFRRRLEATGVRETDSSPKRGSGGSASPPGSGVD